MTDPIWIPCAAMVGLTALVWVKLYADRLGEMRARRVDPQQLATVSAAAGKLRADRGRRQFPQPVRGAGALLRALRRARAERRLDAAFVAAAWGYVGLRALHSLIHVTYNRVVHRFLVYVASTLLLFGMWIAFFARIAP